MIKIDINYPTLKESNIPGLKLNRRGKVRDIYQLDDGNLCMVTSDRISTHDKVYRQCIPHKGYGLAQTTIFAFAKTNDIIPNHFVDSPDPNVMVVKPGELYPIEVIVRGTLSGSAWKEYQITGGDIWGHELPKGMKKDQRLDKPLVTPSTKAITGHDEYITHQRAREIVGPVWDEKVRLSLLLYERGNELASKQGAFIADTKFEFGRFKDGSLGLFDEEFTHDSSRLVDNDDFETALRKGREPNWVDKQLVRNYSEGQGFSGEGEPPELPDYIIKGAAERVLKVYSILSGEYLPLPSEPPTNERIERNLRKSGLI
jgi:phosphoribosylaminoimidazole-succinocarboxamide synthase